MQLKYHFYVQSEYRQNRDFEEGSESKFGKISSNFKPKYTSVHVDNFVDHLDIAVSKLIKFRSKKNLLDSEYRAIDTFKGRDIVIRPADKGAGICVLSMSLYEEKCYAIKQ